MRAAHFLNGELVTVHVSDQQKLSGMGFNDVCLVGIVVVGFTLACRPDDLAEVWNWSQGVLLDHFACPVVIILMLDFGIAELKRRKAPTVVAYGFCVDSPRAVSFMQFWHALIWWNGTYTGNPLLRARI